jgi:hypothetical protein
MKSLMLKIVFVVLSFFCIASISLAQQSTTDTVNLTLTVSANNEINLNTTKVVIKGISAIEAIADIVVMGTKDTSYGPMIVSLAGVMALGNTYWALYVDDKMSMVGAKDVILDKDTHIRLNLESF